MPGTAMKLAGSIASSPFGKFHPYEGTWDSTVYLWDAQYSAPAAVPANGASVTNLARDRAAALSGLLANQCDFEVVNSMANGFAAGEITAKKGIHIASTQAGAQNAASNFALCPSANFANWLLTQMDAGADYALMATLWLRLTRPQIANAAKQAAAAIAVTTGNYFLYDTGGVVFGSGNVLPGNGQSFSRLANVAGATGVQAITSNGWTGAKPANLNSVGNRFLANIGAFGPWAGLNYNKEGSAVIYRAQLDLVDLSEVAGGSIAAKATAMLEAINTMQARDFAAGGRFYGDVYTAPAVLKA